MKRIVDEGVPTEPGWYWVWGGDHKSPVAKFVRARPGETALSVMTGRAHHEWLMAVKDAHRREGYRFQRVAPPRMEDA